MMEYNFIKIALCEVEEEEEEMDKDEETLMEMQIYLDEISNTHTLCVSSIINVYYPAHFCERRLVQSLEAAVEN